MLGPDRMRRYEGFTVMFTGIVTDVGEVLSVEPRGDLRRLRIACL